MPLRVLLLGALLSCGAREHAATRHETPIRLYVASTGNDAWSGTSPSPDGRSRGPFATLERARDEIRKLKRAGPLPRGGVIVEVQGDLRRSQPFTLTSRDSGTELAPIIFRASKRGARWSGGHVIERWSSLNDSAVIQRLGPAVSPHVLSAELRGLGIDDFGTADRGIELFVDDRPMTLARWPNEGFATIEGTPEGPPIHVRGFEGRQEGVIRYSGDRPTRWRDERDLWLRGYWFWDWANEALKVDAVDSQRKLITLAKPNHRYGYRAGQRYYAFNALSELDAPGEWYLDRGSGHLYFWPPAAGATHRSEISVVGDLLVLDQVSHVRFERFTFTTARGTAVRINGGSHVEIVNCRIWNVAGWGVRIEGGSSHLVEACELWNTGEGGIWIEGGDRLTLTPGRHRAIGNHLHDYARLQRTGRPAIELRGVGNIAAHNLIHDAPAEAIRFDGNEHTIELNEIYDVCLETSDTGAIYAGRDWSMRGNVIRHNFVHDVRGRGGRSCIGIYLDDMFSGTLVEGNIFYRVTRAVFIGGGRDNHILNNVFVECDPALHLDARARGWAAGGLSVMEKRLSAVPYRGTLWRKRYPHLWSILADDPASPRGNVVSRNVVWRSRWTEVEAVAEPLVSISRNLVDVDPHFIDPAHLNFQLRADSAAFSLGFGRIPTAEIGLRPRVFAHE